MEKVAPNSNLLGILLKIIQQSEIKGTLGRSKKGQKSQISFMDGPLKGYSKNQTQLCIISRLKAENL